MYWLFDIYVESVSISCSYPSLTSRCDVISVVINIKSVFFGVNFGHSFHICCQNDTIKNISKFSKWPPFCGQANFLTESCTGSWVLHQDRPCHSLHLEILFDVLAQILRELWLFQYFIYFLISWPSYLTFDLQNPQSFVLRQTSYFDHVWWWLVKNCDLYRGKCDNFIHTWI